MTVRLAKNLQMGIYTRVMALILAWRSLRHASNNLAKFPFLFQTTVPRARLRPKYGQGFGRKSGREKGRRVTPGRKGGCNDGSHRDPKQSDGQDGAGV